MKYSPAMYAKAFWDVRPDIKDFLRVVYKHGDEKKLDKIEKAIEEIATHDHGGRMVHIEFARKMEDEVLNKVKKKFSEKDNVHFSINPSLVAGMRITIDGTKELDNSFIKKVNYIWHTK